MTRKKVTLAYITNDSERRASFKKRKKGLIKKVSELSTLCGVEACAIIYSQFEAEPEVWPSTLGAQAVLARFRKMSAMDQTRKMVNQESFTRQRIKKVEDQLRRVRKENKRRELEMFMFMSLHGMANLEEFRVSDAADMGFVMNQMLRDVKSQMDVMKRGGAGDGDDDDDGSGGQTQQTVAAMPPPPPVTAPPPPYNFQAGQEEPPLMSVEELEGFPWNLVQSPPGAGLDDGGLGWDDGMNNLPPYNPYFFNNGGIGPSGTQPGNGGNHF